MREREQDTGGIRKALKKSRKELFLIIVMKVKKLKFKVVQINQEKKRAYFDRKINPMSCCCYGCSGDLCGTR